MGFWVLDWVLGIYVRILLGEGEEGVGDGFGGLGM